ncbi:hypothetical protein PVAND_007383 [Polypedilum vanderplanki]|uniref:Uncharacterized protein n=1 Tax=Polypedilum vanderplanki TaxID=319348 RepID=A0A9J6C6I5_POLVA|nr:hypothetical protein PVAND_007383 [Polypedilum vanderplanki]
MNNWGFLLILIVAASAKSLPEDTETLSDTSDVIAIVAEITENTKIIIEDEPTTEKITDSTIKITKNEATSTKSTEIKEVSTPVKDIENERSTTNVTKAAQETTKISLDSITAAPKEVPAQSEDSDEDDDDEDYPMIEEEDLEEKKRRERFKPKCVQSLIIQIFYQGSTLPLSFENADDKIIVSVVTSKSISDHHEIPTKAADEEQKSESINKDKEIDKQDKKEPDPPVTQSNTHSVAIHSTTTENIKEHNDVTKAHTDVIKPTKKEEASSTMKTHTHEEDEDEDEDYGNPDTDDQLKATCIAALCGIGK